MRFFFYVLIVVLVGLGLGVGSAYWAIFDGVRFSTVRVGPWTAYPDAMTVEADPYGRAHRIAERLLPVTGYDSVSFSTSDDSQGRALDGACTYRLVGALPPTRFWTLSASRPDGTPIANPAGRLGFTSVELLRSSDGEAVITIAPLPQSGNWLPVTEGPLLLVLNLYDTPIASDFGPAVGPLVMPAVEQVACA